ncbi:MAG: DUF2062 domain-containing protein [Tunicatimonas sp.]
MSSKQKVKQRIASFIQRLANENSTPHAIAIGFTLGTFIAILPTPGFGAFLALSLTLVFKNINRLAVVVSIAFWNPLILIPFYYVCYLLGSILLDHPIQLEEVSLYQLLYQYTNAFLLGNIILACTTSMVAYGSIYYLVRLQLRHQQLHKLMNWYRLKRSKVA